MAAAAPKSVIFHHVPRINRISTHERVQEGNLELKWIAFELPNVMSPQNFPEQGKNFQKNDRNCRSMID